MNTARDLSLRLITASLGVRCAKAANLDAMPEEQNRRAVHAEIADLDEPLAVVSMLAEMMAAVLAVNAVVLHQDPMAMWQQVAVGLAAETDDPGEM